MSRIYNEILRIDNEQHKVVIVAIFLLICSALLRLLQLDVLGFYGDEETTALPALSLAMGNGSIMPSGMPYHRALPLTWLNALSANYFGLYNELSYRLPSAILSTITIPVFFLLSKRHFGFSVALYASLLFCFSEWHIITSREARMYGPFLLFFIIASFYFMAWWDSGRKSQLLIAILCFFISVILHALGIFSLLFLVIPLLFSDQSIKKILGVILLFIICAVTAQLYSQYYVSDIFTSWFEQQGHSKPADIGIENAGDEQWRPISLVSLIAGLLIGIASALRYYKNINNKLSFPSLCVYVLIIVIFLLIGAGHFHAAFLAGVVLMLMVSSGYKDIYSNHRSLLYASVVLVSCVILLGINNNGLSEGIKKLLQFPYPYAVQLTQLSPVSAFLSGFFILSIILRLQKGGNSKFIIIAVFVIAAMFVMGVVSRWGGVRYFIEVYPFILLLAAGGLVFIGELLIKKFKFLNVKIVATGFFVLTLSGLFYAEGIPQAYNAIYLNYSATNPLTFGFDFYPDHRSAGKYVRDNKSEGDLIIAEDVLQQYWYIGKVDYWLHSEASARPYTYIENNIKRNIYVGSRLLDDVTLKELGAVDFGKIWLVTSAEHTNKREMFLSQYQLKWLNNISLNLEPEFIAGDNQTRVYLLDKSIVEKINITRQ